MERIELSTSQKNKWEDDWVKYWFYAQIESGLNFLGESLLDTGSDVEIMSDVEQRS